MNMLFSGPRQTRWLKPKQSLRLAALCFALIAAATPLSAAPLPQERPGGKPAEPPTVVTLRPAAEPVPALRYRLMPEHRNQPRGNAALFYHRAIQMLMTDRGYRQRGTTPENPSLEELVSNWGFMPIGEIPREKASKEFETRFNSILNEVRLGASQAHCDWEFDQRSEGIWLLLPEIQEMRSLARLVAVKARLAILEGKTDEAFQWIQTGYCMGRHVAQGPTLIQALVGIAIDAVMNFCLLDLIQAHGTPCLYWALAVRPRPMIDSRLPLEGERYMLERELPDLKNLESHVWSTDEARRFADELQRKLYTFSSNAQISPIAPGAPEDMASFGRRLGISAMAAKLYPEAFKALVAQGWAEEKVKAMPIIQVACLSTLMEYRKARDETYKWLSVPYHQSYDRLDRAIKATLAERINNPLLTLFNQLTPGLNQVRIAFVRLDRQLNALQAIEAIRLYAHNHNGQLPPGLEAITEAPVPLDPATGKPFDYKLSGDSATLTAPKIPGGPDHPTHKINYLLKLPR